MAEIKIPFPDEIEIPVNIPVKDGVPHSGYLRNAPTIRKPNRQPGGQKPNQETPEIPKDKKGEK